MLSNPYFLELMVKEYHRAFEDEAKRDRLAKLARAGHSANHISILEIFADLLIRTGESIKRRYGCAQLSFIPEAQDCLQNNDLTQRYPSTNS